jgi:chaperonin GroEL
MEIIKENNHNTEDVRKRVLAGVEKMNDMISPSFGPSGLSAIVQQSNGEASLFDDGRRTAEAIKLEDKLSHLAARICYNITKKTDERVGDGTTTSTILAYNILKEIFNNHLISGAGVVDKGDVRLIDEKLQSEKDEVVSQLRKMATEVKTEKQLIDVAYTISNNKRTGEMVGSMMFQIGKDGHINLEFDTINEKISSEVVSGYRFSGGYAARWMISNEIRRVADMRDLDVLVVHKKLTDYTEVERIINQVANKGKSNMVIIALGFDASVIDFLHKQASRPNQPFGTLAIKSPGQNEAAFNDMAVFTGCKVIGKNDDLSSVFFENLGFVDHIFTTEDTTVMSGGKGDERDIKKRIKEVEAELKSQPVHQLKASRLERISSLNSGVGLIKIGAPTLDEMGWLKHNIEDAKYATKCAFKDGIVQGGGMAYKKIADKMEEGSILKNPLNAPYEVLKKNTPNFKVGKDVIDPVAVEIAALEYAVSAVSKLMRVGVAITMKPESVLENLKRL